MAWNESIPFVVFSLHAHGGQFSTTKINPNPQNGFVLSFPKCFKTPSLSQVVCYPSAGFGAIGPSTGSWGARAKGFPDAYAYGFPDAYGFPGAYGFPDANGFPGAYGFPNAHGFPDAYGFPS